MRLLILVFLFLLSFKSSSFSQNVEIDSLNHLLKSTSDKEDRSEILLKLSRRYMDVSLPKCLDITNQRIDLAIEMNDLEKEGQAYIWKGRVLGELNKLDSAMFEFNKAEKIFLNPIDSFYLAEIYNGKGIIYKYKGDYKEAIELQYKSAVLSEKMGMIENAATTFNSLGNIHSDLGHVEKAIEFYKKSILNLEKSENSEYPLAGAYFNLGNMLDDNLDEKIKYYKKSERISLKYGFDRILGYLYTGKAEYFGKYVNNIDSQKYYFIKANEFATRANDKYMMAYSKLYLGSLYCKSNPKKSYVDILEALNTKFVKDDEFLRAEGNLHLSKSLFNLKKYKDAYVRLDTARIVFNRLHDIEDSKVSSEADAKYAIEKKDAEIVKQELEILQQKSNQNKIIGGASFLLLLFGGLFLLYNERHKRKKKEAEIEYSKKQMEAEKFKELDIMKNQFFTNITHELRTPLTLIMGPIDNAIEKTTDKSIQKNLFLARNNTHRLLDMINEILDLSKLESGKISINNDEVLINQFLKRILFAFQSGAEMQNIKLEFISDFDEKTGIIIDIEKFEIILNNLISNALKFSPSDESIKMTVYRVKEDVIIEVKDNGLGIPKKEQEHIFNRFYQASNISSETQGGGSGIGLALSKSLITLMGGTISVKSESGKGSTFIISLSTSFNLIDDNKEISQSVLNNKINYDPILLNGEKPHILIIEDNPEMQLFLKDILKDEYRISLANDGYHGLQLLQKNNYDLISCDVMMPKMDGFTLKEKTNELNIHSDIPFVYLTAKVLNEDKLRGLRLGVDDYITKPFNKYEYKARIYNLLENRKSRLEYLSLNTDFALQNMESTDYQTLRKAEKLVLERISDPDLKVNILASELNYSQRQLSRVIKKLTGMTAVKFILELRLQRAYHLIQSKVFSSISEVQYDVGIESASYFTRKFRERYGINPIDVFTS